MTTPASIGRRRFLQGTLGAAAGVLVAPTALDLVAAGEARAATGAARAATGAATAHPLLPFVDHYRTNASANLSASTNAAVDITSGMNRLWQTGTAWNNGVVLARDVLRRNLQHCVKVTHRRTDAEARKAFIVDRQHQSYAMIGGLGPLADPYRAGALAVTSITSAPDGTPATKIDEAVPAGAPAGAMTGAGSPTSELGAVVQLMQMLRGNYSSSNPCKSSYQYPRPWRMTIDSTVVDTGGTDAYGFPVYRSDVVVAPQLLRQRSTTPATDGGFLSGHTNAIWLAGLTYAYAVPERFQELITRAFELADTRIVSGMHSPIDVIGGRILATALAAAILSDPANAELKAAARRQAASYLQAKTGTTADTLYGFAHGAGKDADPYADRAANAKVVEPLFTYVLPRSGADVPLEVPKGAEVLLETRLPYLDAEQRRAVLRTTALRGGYVLLDGPEQWGRLNLFAAADGYGAFEADVTVVMDAAQGGFHAADVWRNAIKGRGGLVKRGTGTLTLAGANQYSGGTMVEAGALVAGSERALGRGDARVAGGTLRLAAQRVRVGGDFTQSGGTLELDRIGSNNAALEVEGEAQLGAGSSLMIRLDGSAPQRVGARLPVIEADRLQGRFATITVDAAGYRAVPAYTRRGLVVKILKA